NMAYHMMKKGVGLDIYYDKPSASGYRNPLQKPNGTPGLATGSAKRREGVLADQCMGCAMHSFGIQRATRPAHLPTLNPRPNRMMKKGVGLHIYYDKLSAPGYRNPLQKPNGSPGLAPGGANRREVVLADQCLGCAMHPFGIQRAKRPAHLPTVNPRTNRMIVDH